MTPLSSPRHAALLFALALSGCEEQPRSDAAKLDAAAAKPGVDPEIAKAVSEVGKGTRFTMWVPVKSAAGKAAGEGARS